MLRKDKIIIFSNVECKRRNIRYLIYRYFIVDNDVSLIADRDISADVSSTIYE